MQISDILSKNDVIIDEKIASKKQTLECLARLASAATHLDERLIFDALLERERLGTTGVGHGVALPHARLADLKKIYCAFLKTKPLDFEAVDAKNVDLVFLLLVPEDAGADHLKALARLSKLLRNEEVAAQLRVTNSASALYKIILENDVD